MVMNGSFGLLFSVLSMVMCIVRFGLFLLVLVSWVNDISGMC